MPLILKIYFACVTGACIGLILLKHSYTNHEDRYNELEDVPLSFKFGAVLIPVVNLAFSLIGLMLLYVAISRWWYDIGYYVARNLGKSITNFRIKEFLIRLFFRQHIDYFHKRLEKHWDDKIEKIIKKILEDEKTKHEPESRTTCKK